MRSKGSPFRGRSKFDRDGDSGPKPLFTGAPVMSGTTLVGNTLTVAFTVTGVGALAVTTQVYRDGVLVDTQTPATTSGVQRTVTYVTTAPGMHTTRVRCTDTNGMRMAASNSLMINATQGPFSAAFDNSFFKVT